MADVFLEGGDFCAGGEGGVEDGVGGEGGAVEGEGVAGFAEGGLLHALHAGERLEGGDEALVLRGKGEGVADVAALADDEAAHGAGVFHGATVEDGHAVAQLGEFAEDVGGDKDGFAEALELLEDLHELDAGAGIEAAGGFVEEEEIGIVDEDAGEGDALLHPAREALDEVVFAPGHIGEGEHVGDGFIPLALGEAVGCAKEVEVFKDAHLPIHGEMIGHIADLASHVVAVLHDVPPEHADAAGLRLEQGGEDFECGGLARAIRPHEAVDALAGDGEGDVGDGDVVFVSVPEPANINDGCLIHGGSRFGDVLHVEDVADAGLESVARKMKASGRFGVDEEAEVVGSGRAAGDVGLGDNGEILRAGDE